MSSLKTIILLTLLLLSAPLWSFTVGFNQAWMKNNYAHQWTNASFDEKYAEDILLLTKESGSQMLRMWLYEGTRTQAKPEEFKNLKTFLKLARKHKVKISLTFLDGNAFKTISPQWKDIFNNRKLKEYYESNIRPVYEIIKDYKDTVTQVDLVNEVNALLHFKAFESGNKGMDQFLCTLKQGSPVPVTASLGWAKAENKLFSGLLNKACLDFYDVHFYNNEGVIPRCNDFKRLAAHKFIQLGEFGQLSKAFDDDLQVKVTRNFLTNARKCGFKSALAWRLDDTRDGYNPEARFSYMAFGQKRPAFYLFAEN